MFIVADQLAQCGLTLKTSKLFCLSNKEQPKQKKTVVESREFRSHHTLLAMFGRMTSFRYLGVTLTTDGRSCFTAGKVREEVAALTKAPSHGYVWSSSEKGVTFLHEELMFDVKV